MKTIHVITTDLKKTIFNWGFLLCAFISITLFITNQTYIDELGNRLSILVLLIKGYNCKTSDDFILSSIYLIQSMATGYFLMFVPIVSAFPFIPAFCSERNTGLIRYTIQRTGKFRYSISKFISSTLGGGLSILLGYVIFSLFVFICFPNIISYDTKQMLGYQYTGLLVLKDLALCWLGMFLFGCVSSVPAFLMSAIIKNRYLITCVSFMLIYLYNSKLTKLSYEALTSNNPSLAEHLYSLHSSTIANLANYSYIVRDALLIFGAFTILSLIIFICLMNKRWDSGE